MAGKIWPRDDQKLWVDPQGGAVSILGGTPSPPVDYDRRVLIFTGDGSNVVSVSPVVGGLPIGQITLTSNSGAAILTYDDVGPLVFYQWVKAGAIGSSAFWIGISQPKNPADYGYADIYSEPRGKPRAQDLSHLVRRRPPIVPGRRNARLLRLLARTNPNLYDAEG